MAHVAFEETIELPIALDRRLGPHARQGRRPAGRDVRDARHLRALQRLPDLPRAAPDPDAARRARRARATSARARRTRGRCRRRSCRRTTRRSTRRTRRSAARRSASRTRPEDLAIDARRPPLRIDKAYSWESPLAAHGLMHMVIANAVDGDPYPIDTLILFMANMAWNSSMNTAGTREMLTREGRARRVQDPVPRRVRRVRLRDGRASPTSCCPTRPTSSATTRSRCSTGRSREPDASADAIRHPIVAPDRDVRPWQEVLVELASRLRSRRSRSPTARAVTRTTRTSSCATSARRASASSPAGAARTATKSLRRRAEPEAVGGVHRARGVLRAPPARVAAGGTAARTATTSSSRRSPASSSTAEPIVMQIWSEPLQKFRLAGRGCTTGRGRPIPRIASGSRPTSIRCRSGTRRSRCSATDAKAFPLHAITQRPMVMYHSWDSQNAWLRQIIGENCLYMNAATAAELRPRRRRLGRGSSRRIGRDPLPAARRWKARAQHRVDLERDRQEGRRLGPVADDAPEATHGFLLNHLISEHLPPRAGEAGAHQLAIRSPGRPRGST